MIAYILVFLIGLAGGYVFHDKIGAFINSFFSD